MDSSAKFSLPISLDRLSATPQTYQLQATEAERMALSKRLSLASIGHLTATMDVYRKGAAVLAEGRFTADLIQNCVVSLLPVPARFDQEISLRFETLPEEGAEIELEEDELDILPIENGAVDLGEAVIQSLVDALDPYPRASDEALADARRFLISEEEAKAQEEADRMALSPFAQLRKN